ncbi:replication initiation protein [Psychrobacter sp. Ps1]|jgi:plasmid replication initiation protein|uniref:replication initiation protein RepM n=1 Tax=Psychrobacter sp. Ps1 TaxID=2790955 RepID=UPI001EDE9751|nr:replication initiation protein RepM [Psychrobacter sp. Ps1]MCG3843653.1 replication initiation protein [Psychrobacter sp. Ps1]
MSDKGLKNEVVKTHRLNTALQKLSLSEIRLMQLAIIDARETGTGIDTVTPLPIHASRYAEAFGVTRQTAYEVLIEAETSLFKRYFTFLDERDGKPVKSHWVSQAKYLDDEAIIEIMLTPAVVKEITRIDAIEAKTLFTRFALEQVAPMKSVYSVRLYELLNQWRQAKKVNFDLDTFRGQLGVEETEYKAMSDFKKRVLDLAVNEINGKSDLKVSYEQVKKGVAIVGFKFKVLTKSRPKKVPPESSRDADTADMFTINGLNDKQLGRIVRNPTFMADYNHLVSPTSPAGQSQNGWEFEMINRLKKDASQFGKRPIREYLEY